MKFVYQHYINGSFVASRDTEMMDILNPVSEQPIAQLVSGNEQDARDAISAAKKAFATFLRSSVA